jgi:meiotically up-regulated gene 157 (Mug157) protein
MAMIHRRELVAGTAATLAIAMLPTRAAVAEGPEFVSRRPPIGQRRFSSPAVEAEIARVKAQIADPEIAWLFENCYPNTLDTTVVKVGEIDGKPDAFVITGDIKALWLRDSSAQMHAYVHLASKDAPLRRLFHGLIQRQARCILIDSYANAFMEDPTAKTDLDWSQADRTDMKLGVAERKWEVDSLCYPMRLAHGYWTATRDKAPFDDTWSRAMTRAVATFREQQRKDGRGPYRFQRSAPQPSETLQDGYGAPTRKVGLIHSSFRPSDDATTLPFLIPSNLFAVSALRRIAQVHREARGDAACAQDCLALASEVQSALDAHGKMADGRGGVVWAYEVDGFGNAIFMDDANVPSLSGLAQIGAADRNDPLFRRTAAAAWSTRNPYFFEGTAAKGIGGPHVGDGQIWPMSIIVHARNSDDDATIAQCLRWLKNTHANTGFMHESFNKDDPATFTRTWFAWTNGMFGELIIDLAKRKPALLAQRY